MRNNRRRGAAAVEFALTAPLLLLILSAVLDYGWYLSRLTSVLQAVREGTRIGSRTDQASGPEAAAVAATEATLTTLGVPCETVTCDVTATMGVLADMDTITVEAEVEFLPLMGIVPTPPTVKSHMLMAMEDQPSWLGTEG
jgi:Flp pilus assembly protein TadG